MIQPILFIYIVIKWLGAWSLFEGAVSTTLLSGMCILAVIGFLGSLIKPAGLLRFGAAIFNGGEAGYGALLPLILWPLAITLYTAGLTDWLVKFHILKSNQGYLLSGEAPSVIDIVLLVITILMFIAPLIRLVKAASE